MHIHNAHAQAHWFIWNCGDFFGSNKTYAHTNKGVFLITMEEASNETFLPVYAFVVVVLVVVVAVAVTNDFMGFCSFPPLLPHRCCHAVPFAAVMAAVIDNLHSIFSASHRTDYMCKYLLNDKIRNQFHLAFLICKIQASVECRITITSPCARPCIKRFHGSKI